MHWTKISVRSTWPFSRVNNRAGCCAFLVVIGALARTISNNEELFKEKCTEALAQALNKIRPVENDQDYRRHYPNIMQSALITTYDQGPS